MENVKQINVWKSILFTICTIIALDSIVAPAIIGPSAITIWIIASILFFAPYGLVNSELGVTYPHDGGIYVWVRKAFGEKTAVIVGWYYWVNVALWMPAVFVAFATWFSYAFVPQATPWLLAGIAILMCWLVVLIGVRGIELSVIVTSICAIAKVSVMLIIGVLGILYGIKNGFSNDFSLNSFIPTIDNTSQYITVIIYNMLGFELIGSIGSKITNPKKTIPIMTIVAGASIALLNMFAIFGILSAIPASEIDAGSGIFTGLKELCSVFGAAQSPVFIIIITVAMLTLVSNMVSWSLGANEVLSAGRLDERSKLLSHRNTKYGTPDALYYIMGIVSTILIVFNFSLSGDANDIFWTLLSFSMLIFLLPYIFMFAAAYKLRISDPDTPRAFKVPGGKIGLLICTILGEFFILMSIVFMLKDAGTGYSLWVLIIGTVITTILGYILYRVGINNESLTDIS